jgi:hypothetical protein|tara:strand:- start:2095 stop:2211 length:117 start_codon:yes stop_codon:yes gene_type:complete
VVVEAEVVLLPVIITLAEAGEEEPLLEKCSLPNPFPPQ